MAQRIKDYSQLEVRGDANGFWETRIENDANGNPLYVGITKKPLTAEGAELWFIRKMNYDGNGYIDHVQLPDNGVRFIYSWTDRATYFT